MKTLVIGCGYVGSALALELARRGHAVTGFRRSGQTDNDLRNAGVNILQTDITQSTALSRIKPEFDWVINCAASTVGSAENYRATYLEGTRNILAWLLDAGIRKYVYTSSTGVYGQDDGSEVDEEDLTEPRAETSRVLVETERLLLSAAKKGFPAVILRVAGIYGPGRGYWIRQFLSGEARLEGEGLRIVNMIHRDDVVGAIIAALERGKPGDVYNAVDDEPVTQRVLFQWLADKLGRPLPPSGSPGTASTRTPANKRILNRKLREDLGYRFAFPTFREGYSRQLREMFTEGGK